MELGKLPTEWLEKHVIDRIQQSPTRRSEVLLRPQVGEDAAILDLDLEHLIVAGDPITGASQSAGYLAVQVNANDIYATGGEPIGILLTVLLPPSANETMLEELMDGVLRATEELGVEVLGGHTEITDAVTRPLISGTMIGRSVQQQTVATHTAKADDLLLMTKFAGLEGSVIIASDYAQELATSVSRDLLDEISAWENFISIQSEARALRECTVTAMHDVTEGGILGAAWELAEAADLGVTIDLDQIPIQPATQQLCQLAQINPYELISSGSLLFTIPAEELSSVTEALNKAQVPVAVIGRMNEDPTDRHLRTDKGIVDLNPPVADALYQVKFKDNELNLDLDN